MDQQDLKLSKKLISSYKKRLEKEILVRSMKLKMPQNKFEEIINNNNELINLKKALEDLETESESHSKVWFLKILPKVPQTNDFLFKSLHNQQLQAVKHVYGPLLVVAGAGSGKTKALTHRIANLIEGNSIDPYNFSLSLSLTKLLKKWKQD